MAIRLMHSSRAAFVLGLAAILLGTQVLAATVICPAVNDVSIDQGSPDTNQGHRTRVLVSWHNSYLAARGLWRFDIPPELEGSQITSAVLVVSRNSTSGSGTAIDVDVFALNAAFNENTDTWNTLGGGDYDDSVVSSGTLPAWASSPPCTASIDLTAVLRGNLDKVRDYGILMMARDEGSGSNRNQSFASKEELPPSTGAYLEIVHTGGQSSTPETPLFELLRNHPNPFNPRTVITFTLTRPQTVALTVQDLAGRSVRTLLRGARDAGRHAVAWDGRDDRGRQAPSGVYLVRLVPNDGEQRTLKVMLAK